MLVPITATGCWGHSSRGATLCEEIINSARPRRHAGLLSSGAISLSDRDGSDGVFIGGVDCGLCCVLFW